MGHAAPFICMLAGASLLAVTPRMAIPPSAWLALTLLLHASRSLPPWPGMVWMSVALCAALAVGNRGVLPVGGPGYFAIVVFYAATLAVPLAVDRLWAPRMNGFASTLVFPMALVATEFLRSRWSPAASWGSLAYTQFGFLPLMQVAAFVGIWGITFSLGWFASTFEWAWSRQFDWGTVHTPVLACAAVLFGMVLAGSARVALAPTDRPSFRAVTINRPTDLFAPGEMTRIAEGRLSLDDRTALVDKLRRLHDWFLDGSRREARAGARLVAWPEQNLLIFDDDEPRFIERARQLAADEKVYLAMGMGTVHVGEALPLENKLVLIDPDGRLLMSYVKSHAVPGWEAAVMRRGDGQVPVVSTEYGRIAAAICFDADFPEFIRQAGERAADVLVVPANEWRAIKTVHVQMAAFRAVENGVSLVRPAATGISSVFDPWGRPLGTSDYFAPGDTTLTVQVPVRGVRTLYAATGDLFAWLCVGGIVAIGILASVYHPML